MKICQVGAEWFRADRGTDRQIEAKSLFRNFVNATKKWKYERAFSDGVSTIQSLRND